ncbi:MAG TPA: NAD-dependent deacylase [Prosthecobacter sp.]|nr:NAD-dependent deacylase [Prosthecobacter sp.]
MTPLHSYSKIVILTGAGVSAESGVPTFRGVDGLWEGHRIEEVASPQAFRRMPEKVHRFYNMRRAALKTVEPNAAHLALAKLEREWPGEFLLVTQNVDDLHERAGSRKLLHMHGELLKVRCETCDAGMRWADDLQTGTVCPQCQSSGGMRPDIVWFGEMPYHMEEIMAALQRADIFVSIGTSGFVYPAAGFVDIASKHGARRRIEINVEATGISPAFNEPRAGPASVEVPRLVEELLDQAAAG